VFFSEIDKVLLKPVIDKTSIKTLIPLEGIQRKIAYAKRKYHSGLICVGVTIGLLKTQLSASINIKG
jgi:hypothetical protein